MTMFKQDRLPYTAQLEWIEGDGESFIDTGLIIDNTLTGEIEFESIDGKAGNPIFGSEEFRLALRQGPYDQSSGYWANGQIYFPTYWDVASWKVIGRHVFTLLSCAANSQVKYIVDGKEFKTTAKASGPIVPDNSLLLFCYSNTKSIGLRIYRAKFQTSTQSFDMIPIRSNDEVCMFDRVSRRIFKNAGTGNFIAGPDVRR